MNTKRKLQQIAIAFAAMLSMAGCQREAVSETNAEWNAKSPIARLENGQIKPMVSEDQMKEMLYSTDDKEFVLEHAQIEKDKKTGQYGLYGEGATDGGNSYICWADLESRGEYLYW